MTLLSYGFCFESGATVNGLRARKMGGVHNYTVAKPAHSFEGPHVEVWRDCEKVPSRVPGHHRKA